MASLRSFSFFCGTTRVSPFLTFAQELKTPQERLEHYVAVFASEKEIVSHRDFFNNYKPYFENENISYFASFIGLDKAHKKQCELAIKAIDTLLTNIKKDTHDWRAEHVYHTLLELKKIHSSIHPRWRSPTGVAGTIEKILTHYELPIDDLEFSRMEELLHPVFTRDRARLYSAIQAQIDAIKKPRV